MTANEKIIIEVSDLKADNINPVDRKWGFIDTQILMSRARADERDRVIEDIKETLTRLYVNDIDITDLYCAMIKELNSLKENK